MNWMIKIKKGMLPIFLILIALLLGCDNVNKSVFYTAISAIDQSEHTKQLNVYDSAYTICYENNDATYSLYIFTSPIQYKTENGRYAIIDNSIVKTRKKGFAFENKANNVKTYFPKMLLEPFRVEKDAIFLEFSPAFETNGFSEANQTIFTNMYGNKVSAVVYERKDMDLAFYPTKAGIKTEIILKEKPESNEFSFAIKHSASNYDNKQNGYIMLKNGGENETIIYQPLVKYKDDSGQRIDVNTKINISREEDAYYVKVIIDDDIIQNAEYPIKFDPSFEMYLNKMADSTVYSKHDINNYLANYAIIGEHEIFGEGWHYVRSRFRYFSRSLKPSHIISSYYYTYVLSGMNENSDMLFLYGLDTQWSSTDMTWMNKVKYGNKISELKCNKHMIKFDITEFTKECLKDPKLGMESRGFVMKSDKMKIVTTSDNSAIVPFYRIDIKELPGDFIENEYINPPNGNFEYLF